MSEINVTPFVDVILCLLIIFMVAAPLMTVGVPIDLPDTAAKTLPSEEEEPLTVTVNGEREVFIQETRVEIAQLVSQLKAIAGQRETRTVFLRGDGSLEYELIGQIMGALQAAGFGKINFVHDPGGPFLDEPLSDANIPRE